MKWLLGRGVRMIRGLLALYVDALIYLLLVCAISVPIALYVLYVNDVPVSTFFRSLGELVKGVL